MAQLLAHSAKLEKMEPCAVMSLRSNLAGPVPGRTPSPCD